MSELIIIAHIHAKADQVDFVKSALNQLVEPTRAEAGCLRYDLHQDNADSTHFMFYEAWQTRELWQQHMQSEHLKSFSAQAGGAIERSSIYEMTTL